MINKRILKYLALPIAVGLPVSAGAELVSYPGGPTEHGSIVVLLAVSEEGAVEGCEVERFSGVSSLDAAACSTAQMAYFNPATDENGIPIRSELRLTIHYIIPHAPPTSADLPIGTGNHLKVIYDPSRDAAEKKNGTSMPGQAQPLQLIPTDAQPKYPSGARRHGEQGRVHVTLDVGKDGKPKRCSVIRSSGSEKLDSATCKFAMKKLRYNPATDYFGDTITSVTVFSLNWSLN